MTIDLLEDSPASKPVLPRPTAENPDNAPCLNIFGGMCADCILMPMLVPTVSPISPSLHATSQLDTLPMDTVEIPDPSPEPAKGQLFKDLPVEATMIPDGS